MTAAFTALDLDGYNIIPDFSDEATVDRLLAAVASLTAQASTKRDYSRRNILSDSAPLRDWATSPLVRSLVESILGPGARAVRGLLFDKVPQANWGVPWHQDLNIAVADRVDVAGFGPWTVKAGVPHVIPPADVLESMMTLRLHLDDCLAENGPLRVIPGGHRHGVVKGTDLSALAELAPTMLCEVPRGGLLLMRPLLPHSSSRAESPAHRRVLHVEYAAGPLPGGLRWAWSQ